MSVLSIRKRTLALVLAVAMAALATLALISYVRGLETKAYAGVEMVSVFVAKDDIPADTPVDVALSRGLIERRAVPRSALAADAVTSLQAVRGMVAATTILKGEQIVSRRFAAVGDTSTLLPIPAGRQAVSVQTDVPPAVGGFVQPGDHVSVIAKVDVSALQAARIGGLQGSRATLNPGAQVTVVHFLLQDVPVLAVGQTVAGRTTTATNDQKAQARSSDNNQVMLTLAVVPADAERLAFAVLQGDVYFTLLPRGQGASRTSGRSMQNLFR